VMIPYDMLLFLSFCLLCGALAVLLVFITLNSKRERERLRTRAELEAKLIDRIEAAHGLAEYLSSRGLGSFDEAVGLSGDFSRTRITTLTMFGCGISFLGMVLFALFAYLGLLSHPAAVVSTVIVLSIGLALLLMAFVAYRMALAWGFIKRDGTKDR
jgi:Flp pilus assembly protein TadB